MTVPPAKKAAKKLPAKRALNIVPPAAEPEAIEPAEVLTADMARIEALIGTAIGHLQAPIPPQYQAYLLRQRGVSWEQAAALTGFADVGACARAIAIYFQTAAIQREREISGHALQQELDRLDLYQNAYWDMAIGGDVKAMGVLLSVSSMRGRWLGWEKEDKADEGMRTILISGDADMAADMREQARIAHPHLVINQDEV